MSWKRFDEYPFVKAVKDSRGNRIPLVREVSEGSYGVWARFFVKDEKGNYLMTGDEPVLVEAFISGGSVVYGEL